MRLSLKTAAMFALLLSVIGPLVSANLSPAAFGGVVDRIPTPVAFAKDYDAHSLAGGLPDLIVNVSAPEEVRLGNNFLVELDTTNIGTARAENSTTRLNYTFCENPNYCTMYGQYPNDIPLLNPGDYHNSSVGFGCYNRAGYYNFTGIADDENNVTESNETNNQNSIIVRCERGQPDLVSRMPGFEGQNFTAYVGDTVPLTILTSNDGYGDAPETVTTVNFEDSADWEIRFNQPPFNGRGLNVNSFDYRCKVPGKFSAQSTADALDRVNESNENNNKDTASIACLKRDGKQPDLEGAILGFQTTARILVGDSFKVTLRTSNTGEGGAGDSITNYAFSQDTSSGGGGSSSSLRLGPLAPGQHHDFQLARITCHEPSEFRFSVQADARNNINETNELNNAKDAEVDCYDRIRPDLVTHFLYAFANGRYYYVVNDTVSIPSGITVSFYEETTNSGNGTALSSTTTIDTPTGSMDLAKRILAPNSSDTDSFGYHCESRGVLYINSTADSFKHVPESNENNNKKTLVVNCT